MPPSHTQLQARTDMSSTSFDTFPIPDTNLVLRFSRFGPKLGILELDSLLTKAQDDIQTDINRYGANAWGPRVEYEPWTTNNIELGVYRFTTGWVPLLGQLRSLIEGLRLYMIKERRSREVKFRLSMEERHRSIDLASGLLSRRSPSR